MTACLLAALTCSAPAFAAGNGNGHGNGGGGVTVSPDGNIYCC
ncbi:MAG: hypothetical protein ACTHK4_10100 [Mycobacteriales bacterium]